MLNEPQDLLKLGPGTAAGAYSALQGCPARGLARSGACTLLVRVLNVIVENPDKISK